MLWGSNPQPTSVMATLYRPGTELSTQGTFLSKAPQIYIPAIHSAQFTFILIIVQLHILLFTLCDCI